MGFLVALLAPRFGALIANVIVYGVIAVIISGTLLGIRHHYVKLGYDKAIAAVKKQDDRAVAAADKVQKTTDQCTETNGYWDVITQNCKLQEETK